MIIAIIILIIVILILAYLNIKGSQGKEDNQTDEIMPYCKKYLLTKNEWAFYKKIKPICEKYNLHIISKVRVADFVEVESKNQKERYKYFNKIKNKHVDFILCNPENLAIIAIVELDDKSHNSKKAEESDKFKNKLFETTGYILIRARQYDDFEKLLLEKNVVTSHSLGELS